MGGGLQLCSQGVSSSCYLIVSLLLPLCSPLGRVRRDAAEVSGLVPAPRLPWPGPGWAALLPGRGRGAASHSPGRLHDLPPDGHAQGVQGRPRQPRPKSLPGFFLVLFAILHSSVGYRRRIEWVCGIRMPAVDDCFGPSQYVRPVGVSPIEDPAGNPLLEEGLQRHPYCSADVLEVCWSV